MATPMEAQPDERTGLGVFLDAQREAILRKLGGLTLEQATSKSTVSDLCLLVLVKHVAFCERRWFQLEIARRDVPGLWPPSDPGEMRVEAADTVESITAFYESIIDENRQILAEIDELDSLSPATGLNRRWVLLHLVEELARHAGHADILRESIDGEIGT